MRVKSGDGQLSSALNHLHGVRNVRMNAVLGLSLLLLGACGGSRAGGGGGNGNGSGGGNPGSFGQIEHVAIVVLENENYAGVIGNSAMPYLNQLAQQNALATRFYANVHPSIGNYFMM